MSHVRVSMKLGLLPATPFTFLALGRSAEANPRRIPPTIHEWQAEEDALAFLHKNYPG